MNGKELGLYQRCAGRKTAPTLPFREILVITGRRAGKSFIAAIKALYMGLFHSFKKYLAPGERGVIQIIAADRPQAGVIFRYVSAILHSNPVFEQYILNETKEKIELSTGDDIQVMTCSFRMIRGRAVIDCNCDEVAFWRIEGADPAHEILGAIRPSMATIPNAMLWLITSPYSRSGVPYEMYRDYYGKEDSEVLVWVSPTRTMNPMIPESHIQKELEKDPKAARNEWLAEFRRDISAFLPLEWIERAIIPNRFELPPVQGFSYQAFTDPSGGAGDAFTLSIGHREGDRLVQDVLRSEKPPMNPHQVVKEYAALLKDYRILTVYGDRYAGEWVPQAFQAEGITYKQSKKNKSDLYLEFEPLLAQGRVELLDNKILFNELRSLERRTRRSGKDSVDHGPRQHDDSANATAGLMVHLSQPSSVFRYFFFDP
jgi:hypothetical protein